MIAIAVVTVLIILYNFNITKHALLILVIFTIIILVLLEQSVLLINYAVETAVFTTAWATKLLLTGLQTGDTGVIYSYVGWWVLRKTEV